MTKAETPGERALATNRKALFNYEILERAEAGIVLVGTEVKSIREGGLHFRDSYVERKGDELFLVGCRIGPYSHGNLHEPRGGQGAQAPPPPPRDRQARGARSRSGASP